MSILLGQMNDEVKRTATSAYMQFMFALAANSDYAGLAPSVLDTRAWMLTKQCLLRMGVELNDGAPE